MRRCALLIACFCAVPTLAQTVVTSAAPELTSVTIYRDPGRSSGGAINLGNLEGFALITETRRVSIPAGAATLRFEGVADGILANSAIITGLPGGVIEKNRDARLLSPAALMDAHIGKEVTRRRTNRATGKVELWRAILRSGPDGMVLEGKDGVEALKCSGLPEALVFESVPEGLSAKPTLSVLTHAERAVDAQVTLAYLARGFDWAAQYVARINPDGTTLNLTSWVTLANSNSSSFVNSQTQIVAGSLNREEGSVESTAYETGGVRLNCWPWDSTSSYPRWTLVPPMVMKSLPVPAPMMAMMRARNDGVAEDASEVIVTAQKVTEEALGDLKLYRVPSATTVAAHGQKQVLMLDQKDVPFERLYRARLYADGQQDSEPMQIVLRTKNEKKNNLGLALPSGKVAVFETVADRSMLAGEDGMRDTAVHEELEITAGQAPGVRIEQREENGGDDLKVVTLTNDRSDAITAEVELRLDDDEKIVASVPRHGIKNGRPLWRLTVPANGSRIVRYRVIASR